MGNHFSKIKHGETHVYYLGKLTQNEVIQIVNDKILEAILTQLTDSEYFSVILVWSPSRSERQYVTCGGFDTRGVHTRNNQDGCP